MERSRRRIARRRAAGLALAALFLSLPHQAALGRGLHGNVSTPVEAIVMYSPGTTGAATGLLHRSLGGRVTGLIEELDLERVEVPSDAVAAYRRSPIVEAVEVRPDWQIAAGKPNDPLVKLQWSLKKDDAFGAWKIETGAGADVKVAVIDTGVDAAHPDLEGRVLDGFDFLDLDESPADDHGHGTHVAGVIAANAANRVGIAGLSFGAKIIPMKSCEGTGSCPVFEVYAGIVDGVRRGAQVVNLSLGGAGECSPVDQAIFDWVAQQGVVAIAAAGNDGQGENPTSTPANCAGTLGVGATDPKDKKAAFSSYGDWVDIAAPGVQIWSTLPALISINSNHLGYGAWDGTSMATPFVAAAAALIKARTPDATPEEISQRLITSARDLGKKGRDDFFGHGLLDLKAALKGR